MFDAKQIGRAKVMDGFNSFTVEIPERKYWFRIIFLCFWLCGWFVGELFAIYNLFVGTGDRFGSLFMSVWLLVWTLGGLGALLSVLFQLVGKDRFVLNRKDLSLERTIFGLGRKRKYNVDLIKHFQLNTTPSLKGVFQILDKRTPNFSRGFISFEYEGKMIFWGNSLSDSDAREIYEDIRNTSFLDSDQFS